MTASTEYILKIVIDSSRKATVYVNNTQYNLSSTPITTDTDGTVVTAGSTPSLAMTDNINLEPKILVEAAAAAARVLDVAYCAINRVI